MTIAAAANAILATHAEPGGGASAGAPLDINARVVSPKPLPNLTNASGLGVVYVDTNSLSRKYYEISESNRTRVNLLWYDRDGVGYVSLRGDASICSPEVARREWWDGWKEFYPNGSDTPFYSVIRVEPDWLEIVSVGRFNVQSGRADWLPVALQVMTHDPFNCMIA